MLVGNAPSMSILAAPKRGHFLEDLLLQNLEDYSGEGRIPEEKEEYST